MLRESSLATDTPHDLASVTDPRRDPLIPGGRELLDLADAALGLGGYSMTDARKALKAELGYAALVDAAAVFATFEMMNRVAEGTGISIGKGRMKSTADVRAASGIDAIRPDW